ncbi:MAG: alpha/beta hydrolase family protein [Verrucomicrobiia bacterium]
MNASRSEYRRYPSSQDTSLELYARFTVPAEPRPLRVGMHGWHGQVKTPHDDNVREDGPSDWFWILPEMRGRGDATGVPDANGWELQDVVDAVDFALREYGDRIATPESVFLTGGSGGGGNVLGLVGKFPDRFCAAVCECGISDYGLWFEHDRVGEFRDELEGKAWIGGSPATNPEGYASRGGLTTLPNLLTPLLLVHGDSDLRCPVEQARRYAAKAKPLGKKSLVTYLELAGVGLEGHFGGITPAQVEQQNRLKQDHLARHTEPRRIPSRGRFVVTGYLKTREFEVVLDHIDRVGEVIYDLEKQTYHVRTNTVAGTATLNLLQEGRWISRHLTVERIASPPLIGPR